MVVFWCFGTRVFGIECLGVDWAELDACCCCYFAFFTCTGQLSLSNANDHTNYILDDRFCIHPSELFRDAEVKIPNTIQMWIELSIRNLCASSDKQNKKLWRSKQERTRTYIRITLNWNETKIKRNCLWPLLTKIFLLCVDFHSWVVDLSLPTPRSLFNG